MPEVNEFGEQDDAMFAGIENPECISPFVDDKNIEEIRKGYQMKYVECVLHWCEELRNLRQMTADFEALSLEDRQLALGADGEMRHKREDKQQSFFKGLSLDVKKALNLIRSLPDKKMAVLNAKRATEHTANVLRDLDGFRKKYGVPDIKR